MCGALLQYLTTENKHFQPMGANMGILYPPPAETRPRDKRLRYMAVAECTRGQLPAVAGRNVSVRKNLSVCFADSSPDMGGGIAQR